MADGFSYGGFAGAPHPYWLSPNPPASTPAFLATHPVESYDQTRVGFDPMIPHHRSPSSGDYTGPPVPLVSFVTRPGHGGEDSSKDNKGGYLKPPYSSATVSSLADMLIRNSQEPFYVPIPPSGVCATTNAFDLNRPGPGHSCSGSGSGYGTHESVCPPPPVVPYLCVPSMLLPTFKTEAFSDGRSFGHNVSPEYIQSGASVEPVLGPLSENPDLGDGTVGSTSSKIPRMLQFDLNCDDHGSWNHFMVSSEGSESMKADNRNAAQSAVSYETLSEASANQPSEDVQAKTCKLLEQFDNKSELLPDVGIKGSSRSNADGVSTGQSPLCDQGGFTSPASSTRVSSVVSALHNLSEVLVYECFNNGSLLKPEQLESLDKVVENLTRCSKKITCNKTLAGEASVPTQAMHVSLPNVADLNEAPNVVAKEFQGFNVKPLDSFGFKKSVDKDEMTQSIKNILASKFPDGEENHPQTLLYKNLWLETEAALCSTTCLARYHRIQKETVNLKLQNREVSADASTFKLEPFLNPQKSVSIINKVEQETAEPIIKHGSNCGNNVVTMWHDAPQSSRFNSAPVGAVLSVMSSSFTGCLEQENHGNFKPGVQIPDTIKQEFPVSTTEESHDDVIDRFQILKQQETKGKLKSQNFPDPDIGVIDGFQILEQQETNGKLKSLNSSETRMDDQEDNPEASEMATIGRSSHLSDFTGRFQVLKRREAEQVQKSLNSVDFDSDSDSDFESDSDSDQPRNRTQRCDYLLSGSTMTIGGNSQIETCANTEPSAYDNGYESPTSDWEHVLKDD
ncbi:hypothetical protein HID58_081809 [Brassica napus]|uniref:(rape) hypothetical protein n=1 Tax=Brassica napus TaxID=3708 RepID=A0A816U7Y8_BRANA|nr:uncharacterized protein BNAC08G21150D isoform X1 [Brassica napus]KAH0864598.1 hypothetical protein HID58_081809 [Brassica napus]CAF2110606.1 unnamed protein product [Brassica napus]